MQKMLKKKKFQSNKTSFVFWGTPDVARDTLEILKKKGFLPSLIITSPDARSGRKMLLTPPPVKIWALENNIKTLQPEKLDDDFIQKLKPNCLEPNCLFIVVAYGKIIPENIINIPRLGSVNIHYSLLPQYRGASPVESAILNGNIETGVTIQKMEYKMDSGPILTQKKLQINPDERTAELRKRLIKIGAELLIKTMPEIIEERTKPMLQDENKATYCTKIKKEDGLINFRDAGTINYNKFRAYSVWPRTYFFKNNKRFIVTDGELINNQFVIKKVIPEGKKEIDWKKLVNI